MFHIHTDVDTGVGSQDRGAGGGHWQESFLQQFLDQART